MTELLQDDLDMDTPDEASELRSRLDLMGITYRANATVESLRSTLDKALAEQKPKVVASQASVEAQMRKDLSKLIRVRVTCMNPNKKNVPGEYVSFMNGVMRRPITKYVPFNALPFHLPACIVNTIKGRVFVESRQEGRGVNLRNILIEKKEFAIEILDPLTPEELKALAQDQKARNAID